MSTHNLEDKFDTQEFLAVRHPELSVEVFRELCGTLKGMQKDERNTGHNIEVVLRFMKGWKLKFVDFRGRRTGTCNE